MFVRNHAVGVSVCAKRNIIDEKHHIIAKHIICTKCNIVDAKHHIIAKHIICTKCNLVHLCRAGGNEVELMLK